MKIHVQRGQIMIKSIAILALVSTLGGCAVYSDAPYSTGYVTTYSSGDYIGGSNVVVTPTPIIVDTYPRYNTSYYNSPYYRPPVYRLATPVYHHPTPHFRRPGFNRTNYPGVNQRPGYVIPSTPHRNHENRGYRGRDHNRP